MRNIIYLFGALILFSCGNNPTSNITSNQKLDSVSIISPNDSLIIHTTVKETDTIKELNLKHEYQYHFARDIDRDSVSELIIINKSKDSSICLSPMFDNNCFELIIDIYKNSNNKWILSQSIPLDDFNSTKIKIDTNGYLNIQQRIKNTGTSKTYVSETYEFNKNRFFMNNLQYSVNTKLYPNGFSFDEWKYEIPNTKKEARLTWTKARLVSDSLVFKDSLLYSPILNFEIKLGNSYSLDSIIGSENVIHYY